MANKKLIERYKKAYQVSKETITYTYAGIALALHRKYGWGFKRINALINESQKIWQECAADERTMLQMCEDETGICIQRRIEEKG